MNCITCVQVYQESTVDGDPILPRCKTGKCPIGDIAPDREANRIIRNFIRSKRSEIPAVQEAILRDVGLIADIDLLLGMEDIYVRWLAFERKNIEEREAAKKRFN